MKIACQCMKKSIDIRIISISEQSGKMKRTYKQIHEKKQQQPLKNAKSVDPRNNNHQKARGIEAMPAFLQFKKSPAFQNPAPVRNNIIKTTQRPRDMRSLAAKDNLIFKDKEKEKGKAVLKKTFFDYQPKQAKPPTIVQKQPEIGRRPNDIEEARKGQNNVQLNIQFARSMIKDKNRIFQNQNVVQPTSSDIKTDKYRQNQYLLMTLKPKHQAQKKYLSGHRGLKNIGNTCYLNSGLQCLNKTKALRLYFGQLSNGNFADPSFVSIYKNLNKEMSRQEKNPYNPISIKKAIEAKNMVFLGNRQQDCCEFVNTVINQLHDSLNEVQKGNRYQIQSSIKDDRALCQEYIRRDRSRVASQIDNIFYGRYLTSYKCNYCKQENVLFQKFVTTYLPIPSSSLKRKKGSFEECLQEFNKEEILSGDNAWGCKCQKDQPTIKSMRFFKVGKVLIFCFKRFVDGKKIDFEISYPKEINLKDLVKEEKGSKLTYSLYGVVVHTGSLQSGHYYAFCMDENKKWWLYNDDQVIQIQQKEAFNKRAYMIFYQLNQ